MEISIRQLSDLELKNMNVFNWPIWECEISDFPWTYSDKESCFIIEGEVVIKTKFESVNINPGDFVIFPKGLRCHWKVLKPIRKYYSFG